MKEKTTKKRVRAQNANPPNAVSGETLANSFSEVSCMRRDTARGLRVLSYELFEL